MKYIQLKLTNKPKGNEMKAQIANNIFDAKEIDGKFFAWVPRKGQWVRVAKTKIVKG